MSQWDCIIGKGERLNGQQKERDCVGVGQGGFRSNLDNRVYIGMTVFILRRAGG